MLGAMLLSAPPRSRNRNLFEHLLQTCAPFIAADKGQSMLLAATIAQDDEGRRAKISSICASWDSIDLDMVNGYPTSYGQVGAPPINPYLAPPTDDPVFAGPTPMDVIAFGPIEAIRVPARSTCVYSSLSGLSFTDQPDENVHTIPGRLLTMMSLDETPSDPFIVKATRNVLDQMKGCYSGQIVSAGPDPLLVLLRNGRPIYLALVYQQGSFYLVWSDFLLPPLGHRCSVWPLVTFDRGPEQMVVGFSMRLLRGKWIRWLSARDRWSDDLLGVQASPDQTASMRIPVAIAALSEWLLRHSNDPQTNAANR